jgi:HYDIN/CFA65/VesB family protein
VNISILFLIVILIQSVNLSVAQPIMKLSDNTVDLGTVNYSSCTSTTLFIENCGTENLEILSIFSKSCFPLFDFNIENKTILPGLFEPVSIQFVDTQFRGKLMEKLIIESNDPKKKKVEILLSVNVDQGTPVIPRRCIFNNFDKNSESRTIIIKNMKKDTFLITDIQVPFDAITVDYTSLKYNCVLNISLDRKKLDKKRIIKDLKVILTIQKQDKTEKINIPIIIRTM